MGRPRNSDLGPVPTKERILQRALELFAERGFHAVSVRQIVSSLGLTEAALYAHYRNKAALLKAIFDRLEDRLINPGFQPPSVYQLRAEEPLDITSYLMHGARRFFDRTDRETMLTWRLLIVSQYHLQPARESVQQHLLEAPLQFFRVTIERMQQAGKARRDVSAETVARLLAAVFFQHSFEANLQAAWEQPADDFYDALREELELISSHLLTPNDD